MCGAVGDNDTGRAHGFDFTFRITFASRDYRAGMDEAEKMV